MSTSSNTAASTDGSIFLRRMHFTATCLPVARCTPLQTVENVPLLSCVCFGWGERRMIETN